ncbi:MAG: PilZ domain-containing protein [Bdellovibrionales bacterium]|nr:PilZ domain-containing protein [Bdellovibrionales bacterium]
MAEDKKRDIATAAGVEKPKGAAMSPGASLVKEALAALQAKRASAPDEASVDPAQIEKIRTASVAPVATGAAARRTPRRPFQRPVGLLVGGHYEVLRARQLSEGGMSIFLGEFGSRLRMKVEEVQVGKPVSMSFILPSGESISLRGEVIYHDTESGAGLHIGVKFGVVPMAQRRMIRSYVSSKRAGETVEGMRENRDGSEDQFASVGVTRRAA